MDIVLEGRGVGKNFGGLRAVADVDFAVRRGEIFGLIGPNGAGKTTLLNIINGIYAPTSGRVLFEGRDITGVGIHAICQLGIGRVLQITRTFDSMTVLENVAVGAAFGGRKRLNNVTAIEQAEFSLQFVNMYDKKDFPLTSLTAQEKKLVEMARALALRPTVILMDEVMSGLTPVETEESMRFIRKVRDELQVTVVWVEHVMKAIMGVAERVMVLEHGRVIATGSPGEVTRNEKVVEAYLGKSAA